MHSVSFVSRNCFFRWGNGETHAPDRQGVLFDSRRIVFLRVACYLRIVFSPLTPSPPRPFVDPPSRPDRVIGRNAILRAIIYLFARPEPTTSLEI